MHIALIGRSEVGGSDAPCAQREGARALPAAMRRGLFMPRPPGSRSRVAEKGMIPSQFTPHAASVSPRREPFSQKVAGFRLFLGTKLLDSASPRVIV